MNTTSEESEKTRVWGGRRGRSFFLTPLVFHFASLHLPLAAEKTARRPKEAESG